MAGGRHRWVPGLQESWKVGQGPLGAEGSSRWAVALGSVSQPALWRAGLLSPSSPGRKDSVFPTVSFELLRSLKPLSLLVA